MPYARVGPLTKHVDEKSIFLALANQIGMQLY